MLYYTEVDEGNRLVYQISMNDIHMFLASIGEEEQIEFTDKQIKIISASIYSDMSHRRIYSDVLDNAISKALNDQ